MGLSRSGELQSSAIMNSAIELKPTTPKLVWRCVVHAFRKVYLGDSVYIEIENGMVKLTTENGFGATNTIFLNMEVYEAMLVYVAKAITAAENARSGG